jgi:Uncharacterized protein conserved in bacteria
LPCKNQDALWTPEQQTQYQNLLKEADEIVYISEKYNSTCMKKRNYYMVEQSEHCVCALVHERSGTGQTVRYARDRGLKIVNVIID